MNSSTQPRIALAYPLTDSRAQGVLASKAEVIVATSDSVDDLTAAIKDADGLIMRGPAKITDQILASATALKVIASSGSGADCIDIPAATARGILVTNNAGIAPTAVSEYVIAAAIVARRRLVDESRRMFDGTYAHWDLRTRDVTTREVVGCTFGVVGYGHIGRDVARRARAGLDAHIVAFDPYVTSPSNDVEWVDSLLELCGRSDVVTVHVPLQSATRGLVGRAEMEAIGGTGALVNAARGGIVDLDALVDCLAAGTLGGAAIDVYDSEPPAPDLLERLRSVRGLFCTPHIAGVNADAMHRLATNAADSVLLALSGTLPTNALNPEVWPG